MVANPRIDETYAFGGSGYLGWSQDSVRDPNHYDLYLRSPDGRTVKVNPAGTQAFGGGIDGNTMVYEQFTKRNDDLWIVDLTTMAQTRLTPTVTSSPEWEPTISGNWILFARTTSRSTVVLLYNRATGELRQLASLGAGHQYVYPGQVNGNYVVWGRTTRRSQRVYLYDIAARRTMRLAQPSRAYQYDPAVSSNGTVYFVRSKAGCGESVVIYKQPLGGSARLIQRLRSGTDVNFTLYASTTNGQTQVLYSRLSCRTKLGDVYALTG